MVPFLRLGWVGLREPKENHTVKILLLQEGLHDSGQGKAETLSLEEILELSRRPQPATNANHSAMFRGQIPIWEKEPSWSSHLHDWCNVHHCVIMWDTFLNKQIVSD